MIQRFLFVLVCAACAATSAPNLFTWQGLEADASARPQNIDTTTDAEFLAFSRGIRSEGELTFFDIPRSDAQMNYRYVGLGPFPVDAMQRYRFSFRMTNTYGNYASLWTVTFLAGDQPLMFRPVVNPPGDAWMSDTLVSQDLPTPPGADHLILWLGVSGMGKPVRPGIKLMLRDVRLEHVGTMDGNPQVTGKSLADLAPAYVLEEKPPGPLTGDAYYSGGRDKEVDLEIVELASGTKGLRLTKETGDYTFPHTRLADLPYDNTWLRFGFRAKGSGRIAAGIWWMRGERTWSYGAGPFVELTDDWQEVSFLRSCTDATARGGAVAFHLGSDTLDATIDNLTVTPVIP